MATLPALLMVIFTSQVGAMLITSLLARFWITTSRLIPGHKRTTCQAPKTMFEVALSRWIRFSCSAAATRLSSRVVLLQNQRLLFPLRSLRRSDWRKQATKSRFLLTANNTNVYVPDTDEWRTSANMNVFRAFTSGAAIGTNVYAAGGYDGTLAKHVASAEVLAACVPEPTPTPCPGDQYSVTPGTDTWSQVKLTLAITLTTAILSCTLPFPFTLYNQTFTRREVRLQWASRLSERPMSRAASPSLVCPLRLMLDLRLHDAGSLLGGPMHDSAECASVTSDGRADLHLGLRQRA